MPPKTHLPSRISTCLGSFTNYVDKFLAFLITYPTSVAIFYPINVGKKSTYLNYLSSTLVNVVCERPLCLIIVVVYKSNHLKWKSILLCSKQLYCLNISWKFIGIKVLGKNYEWKLARFDQCNGLKRNTDRLLLRYSNLGKK